MNPEPQWHDFPFKSGLYALRCDGYMAFANIHGNGQVWYYRNEGHAYSYPFDYKSFDGKCYGPIELPKV